MAGIKIESGSNTAGSPNVDANYNLNVNLPAVKSQAGFATMQTEIDDGSITGTRLLRRPFISVDDRMSVGIDTAQAMYNFTATAQNTGDFKHAFTTMTMTQTAGFLNINPALATVSGNYAYLQSWKYFTLQADAQLHMEFVGQVTGSVPPANQILEAGLFIGTAGTAPADGVFFRLSSAGLQGVISYNGVETSSGVMVASMTPNTNGKFEIKISQRDVFFWIDGVLGAKLPVPAGQAVPYLWLNLPACMMMRNSGTVSGGITTKIGSFHVSQTDIATNKSWAHQMATQGNAYQGQEGDTQGSLAIYSNAAVAAAAALTNTTAAAPNTGLGGVVQVLPTLTAGTDGILLSYQNPVGSVTQPPKTLVVTGVTIDSGVTTVLAGGPLVMVMGAAFGHTALSLATAESASFATGTTKAPRRVPLGMQCYAAAAAVGVTAQAITMKFDSPITVHPGEYFAITARNLGTVTTTGAVCFVVGVDHYFE
jgi:hypothetical protein